MGYLDDLFSLGGRSAVVTGGSSGIGRGIAEALARSGAEVRLVARDVDRLAETAAELRGEGLSVTWESVDLADAAALARLCAGEAVAEADVLVTSAGVNRRPELTGTTEDDLRLTLDVNLMAPYRLGQAAGPRMAARGFGRLVHLGSQQTWSAFGRSGVYGVTKAAIGGLVRSQAEAWSYSGVTANAIVPGFVVTPMTAATVAEPGRAEALADRTMIGRNGRPDDFAGVAVWLASAASAYVTGQLIAVDGGFSVH